MEPKKPEHLRASLLEFIAEELLSGGVEIDYDDDLLTEGLLDSMRAVSLVVWIHESFGYQIPSQDLTIDNFRTVNRLAEYLEPRISYEP